MRVADFIVSKLADNGFDHVFLVTGGGAMHLNDAFTRDKRIKPICFHHEQACSMAADGYARLSNKPAIVNVTTGPGAINSLNGVFGAFTDSIPMIVIGGQVKSETLKENVDPSLRQLGDQEVDTISMVKPITKFAYSLRNKEETKYILEKAIFLVNSGRPGPVWIDVPGDIQGQLIDPTTLKGFEANDELQIPQSVFHANELNTLNYSDLMHKLVQLRDEIVKAERPVVLVGTGVTVCGQRQQFIEFIETLGIPVVTAFNAHDLIPYDHYLFAGKAGTVGDRAGNFAVQNSDLVIILGCRLNIRQISYNYKSFARYAKKIMVDVDKSELSKPTIQIDMPIHADLRSFFSSSSHVFTNYKTPKKHKDYLNWCVIRREKYPTTLAEYYSKSTPINPYVFGAQLFDQLQNDDVVVTANATACVCIFQSAKLKKGVRLFSNSGSASMGFDLPAAIGAEIAKLSPHQRTICIAGDGSIMMNLQELQTIIEYSLPIKIFILCNDGYHSIYQTQKNFFSDNVIGCGPGNGLSFPNFIKICNAFGLASHEVSSHDNLHEAIENTLVSNGPHVCVIHLDKDQPFAPKLSSRRLEDGRMVTSPLEDMAPFLPRDELRENMLVPIQDD